MNKLLDIFGQTSKKSIVMKSTAAVSKEDLEFNNKNTTAIKFMFKGSSISSPQPFPNVSIPIISYSFLYLFGHHR
jgi:hypothetical protein